MKSTLRFLKICSLSALLVSPTGLMAQPANPVAITQPMMLSMNVTRKPVENVLESLGRKTGLDVHYDRNEVNTDKLISLNCKNQSVKEVLASISDQTGLRFEVFNNKLIVSAADGIAQELAKITGTVKDNTGQALVGVSVHIKGTTTGAQTNASGIFVLDAKPGDVLVFSYIGYTPQEVTVSSDVNIAIVLTTDSKSLQEVVVTAFGIKRSEKSLTYATQRVSSDQLNTVKTDNLVNSLNGKVAGLTISPGASGVGSSAKVILRGSRSANGSNQPLYVIDGVPILNTGNANSQPTGTFGGTTDGGDGISNLNPEDIESITVLEGASAAALYGSQAQNGVLLITTKKGKAGKAQIDFSSSFTANNTAYRPKFQNQYGQTAGAVSGDVTSWGPAISNSEDNLKKFFQTGTNLTNAINFSSGSELAQTYFSYANTHARGIEPGNKLDRNNFNLRETGNFLNGKLTVDGSINYINQEIQNAPQLGIYSNPLISLYAFPRGVDIQPYKTQYEFPDNVGVDRQNWITHGGDFHQDNPWWIINREPNFAKRNRMLLNGSVKYTFNNYLNIQVRGNVDRVSDDFQQNIYSGSNNLYNSLETGNLKLSNQTLTQKYGDVLVNFVVPLKNSDFKINGLLGASVNDQQSLGYSFGGDLQTPDYFTPGNIIVSRAGTSTSNTTLNSIASLVNSFALPPNHSQTQAIFANADFSYKNWAYLTVTGRKDWSSNLSFTNNNSYVYPSAGLSVILTQALELPKAISYAKVRVSLAQVGNTVPPYLTNIQNTQDGSGALVFNTAGYNGTLKPEKTNSFELGADMRFINDKLNFSFTYYKTNTLNQYIPVVYSAPTLVSTGYVNAGNVQNTGLEFTLGYDVLKSSRFSWNTTINASTNKNKIIDVDSKDGIDKFFLTNDGNSYQSELVKGGSYGDIYAPTLLRDDKGRVVLGGDGTAASPYAPKPSANYNLVGNPNPKFQLGWNNSFSYQKLSLNFLVDGKFGGKVMSITQGLLDATGVSEESGAARAQGGVKVNGVNAAGQAVTTVNAQTWYQTIGQRGGITGEYMYSATVVRLREASLGYTWSIANSGIKSVKLSVVGRNILYFYKKAPFDPEIAMSTGNTLSGIDVFNQPATRNLGLNLNVSF